MHMSYILLRYFLFQHDGRNALHICAWYGYYNQCVLMISRRVDITARDKVIITVVYTTSKCD